MAITIKYFGAIEEITGVSTESVSSEEYTSLNALKAYLLSKYSGIEALSFQLAVNQSLTESASLHDGDEVALLPPFAGG